MSADKARTPERGKGSVKEKAKRGRRADAAPGEPAARVAVGPPLLPRVLASVLAGVLIFLSFPFTTAPDSNIWPLAWFSFVPFLWALEGARKKRGFWLGALTGLVTNFGGFWWVSGVVRDFGHLPDAVAWPVTALNAGYQGLAYALFGLLYAWVRPRGRAMHVLAVAALFTVIEYAFPLIFPWFLGNGQYRALPVIQIADVTGVMGITFVIVAVGAGLYQALRALRGEQGGPVWRPLVWPVGLLAVTLLYGFWRLGDTHDAMAAAEKLSLGMVEADIGIWEKQAQNMDGRSKILTLHRNLLLHQELSKELADKGAELIVWPESSYFPLGRPAAKRVADFAVGLTERGALVAWTHDPAAPKDSPTGGFAWRIARPKVAAGVADAARYEALAAEREDAWVAVGARGAMLRGTPTGASALPAATDADLHAVAVVAAPGWDEGDDGAELLVTAAGDDGVVVTGNETVGFAVVPTGVSTPLRAVGAWGGREAPAYRAVAAGDGGVVLELEGCHARVGQGGAASLDRGCDVHRAATRGVEADWKAVWARPGAELEAWVVGTGGRVLHRAEGGAWAQEVTPVTTALTQVAGDAERGDVWAAGAGGVVLRRGLDGNWRREALPSSADVTALTLDARMVPLAATADGGLFRRDASGWRAVESAGVGEVVALTALPFVLVDPLPRDILYLWQGRTALPDLAVFDKDPSVEMIVPPNDRNAPQRGFDTPLLFGGLSWQPAGEDGRRHKFNTAYMLDHGGRVVGTYDKNYLLVFGEYVPFGEMFPSLYDVFKQSGRFDAGREVKAFDWNGHRLGVMICYEDILPKFTGRLADQHPNIILNVTNDAWFGQTSEPYLHLALAVFRAVENRLVLARATNTGVSAIIDPTGAIVAQTKLTDAETLLAPVPLMTGATVYGRVGDLFTYLAAFGLIGYVVMTRRRERKGGDDVGTAPPAGGGRATKTQRRTA
ncbi:MAG: apolipoprotein N-acyltransferase [Deltaproteobacteria bacterium]|nr:apolipoprotein N-acyltransferase [Deltaproteobacteria bacterium]